MNHAITFFDLLMIVAIIGGLIVAGFGFLEIMAGGMSDAPEQGSRYGRNGCFFLLIGIALVAAAIYGCSPAGHPRETRGAQV